MRRAAILSLLAVALPVAAHAAKPEADSCAASLSAEAKTIYTAVSPSVTAGIDLRALVKEKVTAMVKAGTVSMGSARSSATAAGKCLVMLQ
jgi:hypothetical protein